ncbi:hypothetical protein [Shewanella indica]|uniref:hypothetical protein n=1 Tax=Shewanella indica TaxID=768528 RepID=UPI00399A0DAA
MKRFMLQFAPKNSSRAEIRQIPDYIDDTGKNLEVNITLLVAFLKLKKVFWGQYPPSDGRSLDEKGQNLSISVGEPVDYWLVTGDLRPADI